MATVHWSKRKLVAWGEKTELIMSLFIEQLIRVDRKLGVSYAWKVFRTAKQLPRTLVTFRKYIGLGSIEEHLPVLVPLRIINLNLDLEEARIFKRVNREQHNSCERNQILTEILNLLEEGKLLCCSRKYGWKGLQVKPDIRLVVPSTIPFEGQATNSLIQAGDTKWRVKAKTDSCRFSTAFASSPFRKKLKEDGTSTEDPATRGYAGESWRNVRGGSCLWSCVRLGVKGKLFLCMQLARVRAMNCQSKLLNGGFLVTLTVQIDWSFLFLSGKNLEVRSVKVCRKNRFCQITVH